MGFSELNSIGSMRSSDFAYSSSSSPGSINKCVRFSWECEEIKLYIHSIFIILVFIDSHKNSITSKSLNLTKYPQTLLCCFLVTTSQMLCIKSWTIIIPPLFCWQNYSPQNWDNSGPNMTKCDFIWQINFHMRTNKLINNDAHNSCNSSWRSMVTLEKLAHL